MIARTWFAGVTRMLPPPERLGEMGIRIAVTLILAFAFQRVLYLIIARSERLLTHPGHSSRESMQRARTLSQIARNLSTVLIAAAVLIHVLAVLGTDVRPLLAGAGILGVAVGFGAQTLVRDVIAGVFILAENQYVVGDLVEVNGKPATVESITVRVTTLRDFNGYVHFVPNGEMKVVTNRSRGWNRLAVDVLVKADQDVDRALDLCRRVVDKMNDDDLWKQRLLDPIELWGVESAVGADVQIRMTVRAEPGSDAPEAARELRRRVLKALSDAGIPSAAGREPIATTVAAPAASTRPAGGS